MGSRPVVVGKVRPEYSVEMALAEDNDVIQAFSTDRSDETLGIGVLPRRFRWPFGHEVRDAALADDEAKHEQLAVDLGCTPERIGLCHPADESLDLGRNLILRRSTGARLPTPEQAETGPMPTDDCVRLDDD